MSTSAPLAVAIVGVDGCGKSSTFRGALSALADRIRVAGIGDQLWSGGPSEPLRPRTDVPRSRFAQLVGRLARGMRRPGLYKHLKLLERTERTYLRAYLSAHEAPAVILTDGDPLINTAATSGGTSRSGAGHRWRAARSGWWRCAIAVWAGRSASSGRAAPARSSIIPSARRRWCARSEP